MLFRAGAAMVAAVMLSSCDLLDRGYDLEVERTIQNRSRDVFGGRRFSDSPLGRDCAIPPDYMNPKLIVIGDSLSNGVQSLYLDRFLSEWSFPNLIALRAGLIEEIDGDRNGKREFYSPDYDSGDAKTGRPPPPVGLVLSDANLIRLANTTKRMDGTYRALRDRPQSPDFNGRKFVENLGAFGMSTVEVSRWTLGDYKAMGAYYQTRGHKNSVASVFYRNAYFVFNPTADPCIDGWTVVDQVVKRQPERVLIALGANNGLYNMGFRSKRSDEEACTPKEASDLVAAGLTGAKLICTLTGGRVNETVGNLASARYVTDMKFMLDRLNHQTDARFIYVLGLIQPDRVANQVLVEDRYQNAFDKSKFLSRSTMDQNKSIIQEANRLVSSYIDDINKENMSSGISRKIVFLDIDRYIEEKFDYKGCIQSGAPDCLKKQYRVVYGEEQGRRCIRRFDNRPFMIDDIPEPTYCRHDDELSDQQYTGGFFSLDNMHPSSVGYAILGEFVVDEMKASGDTVFDGVDKLTSLCGTPQGKVTPGSCAAYLTAPKTVVVDRNRADREPLRVLNERSYRNGNLAKWLLSIFQ